MRFLLGVAAIAVLPALALAQSEEQLKAAANLISAEEIARHVSVIGHDSMQGRDTPSSGLEKTAAYVADQFGRAGLRPAGDSVGWIQRYWVLPQLDFAASRIGFTAGGKTVTANFTRAARLIGGRGREHSTPASVVLVTGLPKDSALARAHLSDKIVIYVSPKAGPWNADVGRNNMNTIEQLYDTVAGLVVLSEQDSSEFAQRQHLVQQSPGVHASKRWAVAVRPDAVPGLRDMLTAAGIDLDRMRTDTTPVIRELPSLQVSVDLKLDRVAGDSTQAPNVIGFLEGTDPKLNSQFVVFVAHMDAAGPSGRQGSTNDADDNAAGVASLIGLAKALAQPGMRPARSIAFVATSGSGSAKSFWGSSAFVKPLEASSSLRALFGGVSIGSPGSGTGIIFSMTTSSDPTTGDPGARNHVNLFDYRATTAFDLDHMAHTVGDTVVVDGVGDAQFAILPRWAAAAQPELRLNVLDGPTAGMPTSDQYPFLRSGIPALYFHSVLDDSLAAPAHLSAADLDWTARVARLAFYMARDIANAEHIPAWTSEGRRAFLRAAGQ